MRRRVGAADAVHDIDGRAKIRNPSPRNPKSEVRMEKRKRPNPFERPQDRKSLTRILRIDGNFFRKGPHARWFNRESAKLSFFEDSFISCCYVGGRGCIVRALLIQMR